MQDEKLALANAVKQALSTARDAAQDDGSLPPPDKPARAPRPKADRVCLVWLTVPALCHSALSLTLSLKPELIQHPWVSRTCSHPQQQPLLISQILGQVDHKTPMTRETFSWPIHDPGCESRCHGCPGLAASPQQQTGLCRPQQPSRQRRW